MATETIGTGGDYANELQWVAGIPASLAANEIGVGLTGEHSNSSTDIYISGITLNGFTLQLTAQAGNSFIDNINPISDRIFYDPTMGAACLLTGNCYRFTTEVPMTINKYLFHKESDFESLFYLPSGSASTLIDQIIGKISNGGTLAGTFRAAPSGEIVLRRSILYSTNNIDSINYAGINISAENCLFINLAAGAGTTGFRSSYSSSKARNCAVIEHDTDFVGTSISSSSNNATSNGTIGGTGFGTNAQVSAVASDEFENVTAGTEDFRLKSTSTKLRGNGTATNAPATDMFNRSWNGGVPDIGPLLFDDGSGGGGGETQDSFYGRNTRGIMNGINRGLARVAESIKRPILVVPRDFFPKGA
jgi:hypothetical protein